MENPEKQENAPFGAEQHVIFWLHDELFSFEIALAQEITELLELNEVPMSPDFIAGAVNLHSRVIGVLSLSRFFEVPSHEKSELSRIIVLAMKGYSAGFLVDNVKEISFLPAEGEGVGNLMEGESFKSKYVKRVVTLKDFLVNVLDVKKLLDDLKDYFKEN
ncbi:MAG: chemotaxis protein CheW [Proteobacteria bacterium]|nr:chemotaxis protein CheW [Pseudomonadota bacterium]